MIHNENFPFDNEDDVEIVHVSHEEKSGGGILGKLIIILIVVALIGLSGKALYDFGKGGSGSNGSLAVIEPNPEPYKVAPEDPGGMDIPHIDKEVYELKNRLDAPIDTAAEQADPIASIIEHEEKFEAKPLPINKIAIPKKPPKSELKDMPEVVKPKSDKSQPKIVTISPNGEATTSLAKSSENQLTGAKKISIEKILAKKSGPEIWLQLGTFRTEQEATKAWQTTREKNSDILGGTGIKVTKSDMAEQGIFYRLQSGPVDSEEQAKNLCRQLNGRSMNCFYAIIKPEDQQ